jgi:acyl-CoA reductase-like NAD-dependent aldehyde dehydrogenase
VLGGEKHPIGDLYFRPTILTHLKPDMAAFKEEIFGPVISVIKFKTEEEALELANSTRVGLAGYFFSNDVRQCWRVAKKMEANIILKLTHCLHPFLPLKPTIQGFECFTIFLSQLT